jgi:hypothetical protein
MNTQHAIVGFPDEDPIPEQDWPAWSAGFEAGLREGITRTRLQISVELVPTGPAHAGIRLWRAVTAARLTDRTSYTQAALTGEQLRERARRSWGLPPQGHEQGHEGGRGSL